MQDLNQDMVVHIHNPNWKAEAGELQALGQTGLCSHNVGRIYKGWKAARQYSACLPCTQRAKFDLQSQKRKKK